MSPVKWVDVPSPTNFRVPSDDVIDELSDAYRRFSCVRFPDFFHSSFLARLSPYLEADEFYAREDHEGIGTELCMPVNAAYQLLHFAVNDPVLFRLIESITGARPIRCFQGRVYRMTSEGGHGDTWHSDVVDTRLVGMSVNLGREPFEGGVFRLRESASQRVITELPNPRLGDAILFRIGEDLQHHVTPVQGPVPKTAFAGWFKSEPDFFQALKESAS